MEGAVAKSDASTMLHYMPEIIWHDRDSLLSVHFQALQNSSDNFYKLVTSSLRKEVRVWKMDFRMLPIGTEDLGIHFIANLVGHRTTVNIARFSPDGELLVSGDCDGFLIVWKISQDAPSVSLLRDDDFPSNSENWVRYKTPLSHDSDICSICWSPDSKYFATASNDESVAKYEANTGKRIWHMRSYRRFPNGITWDPRNKYIVTMSTDRKLDILCAKNGTRLQCIQSSSLPTSVLQKSTLRAGIYKLFHDDQLMSFSRIPEFSPDGELLFAPCGNLEVTSSHVFGTYIFRRCDFDKGRPVAFVASTKATFRVSCNPVLYELRLEITENALRLPYRIVWAVLTRDSVSLFDSQLCRCIGYVSNLQYDALTDMSWSDDGRVLMISSLEGYINFIRFGEVALGTKYTGDKPVLQSSPQLNERREIEERNHSDRVFEIASTQVDTESEKREGSPVNSLFKYFKRIDPPKKRGKAVDCTSKQSLSETMVARGNVSVTVCGGAEKGQAASSSSDQKVNEKSGDVISNGIDSDLERVFENSKKKRAKLIKLPSGELK